VRRLPSSSAGCYLGEIQNNRVIRTKRKDLARMLTVLSEALIKEAN
jgi:ribosomal protein L29